MVEGDGMEGEDVNGSGEEDVDCTGEEDGNGGNGNQRGEKFVSFRKGKGRAQKLSWDVPR